MTADIEKAFLQVSLQTPHRNSTRFLWFRDPRKGMKPGNLITYRFTRIPFGIACSPFLLDVAIRIHLESHPHPVNEKILSNLYVDNVLFTTNDREELMSLYEHSKAVFTKCQMNLREYLVNDQETMVNIPSHDQAKSTSSKLLGYAWDAGTDTLSITIAVLPKSETPTKREIASFLGGTYDPMGLVCPITISTKMLMQLMWKEGVSWDSPIPKKLLPEWKKIRKAFEDPCYYFPRQLTTRYNYEEVQMLVFCDANDHNFAACVYLRFSFKDSPPVTNLYLAKTRQKSLNQTSTTPRMELMAIEIGLNAAATLIQEKTVNVSQIKIFSDSQIALYWILKGDRCHAFVSNRVATINDVVASLSGYNVTFHHVPGSSNPADIASRGATLAELKESSLWQHGPDFLKLSPDQWPNSLKKAKDYEEDELKAIMKELVMPTASTKKKLSKFQTVAINVLTAQTIDAAWKTEAYTPRVFRRDLAQSYHALARSNTTTSTQLLVAVSDDEFPLHKPGIRYKSFVPYTGTQSMVKLTTTVGFIMKFLARAFPHQLWKTPLMKTLAQLEILPRTEEGSVRLSLQITARELVRNYILKDHYLDDFFSNSGDNPGNFRLRCHRSLAPIRASDGLFHIRRPIEQSHASTSEKFP
uniref:Reverse transcriptase domain-containing protein n=1 Tax=Caenorhabditis japonica TaxID=281687 RepID=A0A8R1I581_CAEJA